MMYFKGITAADRVRFEGREVHNIVPVVDTKTKEVSHFSLSVEDEEEGAVVRKFRVDEIPHLIDNELLEIDRGYHSIPRQVDRSLYGGQELFGATKKQRVRVDRIMFLVARLEYYHNLGMILTRAGVDSFRLKLDKDFQQFQARAYHGTDRPNASQKRYPLPANSTLLGYYKTFRRAGGNPNCFLVPKKTAPELSNQMADDFAFVMQILSEFADDKKPAKSAIAEKARGVVAQVNESRRAAGFPVLIKEKCARTYERWIDTYLDPFTVVMKRDGLAAARRKFKTSEQRALATFPGQMVQYDAWMFHIATLDVSRQRWQEMTEEERKTVKRVRRWVVVAIDVATRCIVGFSICRNPNQRAALEAMRMCYHDKTYLLRNAGIKKSTWNFVARHHMTVTDSGSEFGKHPFGGALFVQACRTLTGSMMNTTAGIPELRGHIERFFFTCELKFARHVPGWTASNPSKRNDRKPHHEASLMDDDLEEAFTGFVAEYHTTPHRGLDFKTPAGVWEEMTSAPEFDPEVPGPKALREACGFYTTAEMGENGIRYARNAYSNEFVHDQRMARGLDRIAKPGETVEIKVDPYDLGAISVLTGDDLISVKCTDPEMAGKSLRQADREHEHEKRKASEDKDRHADQRREASETWRSLVAAVAKESDVGIFGYTDEEVSRARREISLGKGLHEEPYIGLDEYEDPLAGGYETDVDPDDFEYGDQTEVAPDTPNSMDRFRSKGKRRSRRGGDVWEEGEG